MHKTGFLSMTLKSYHFPGCYVAFRCNRNDEVGLLSAT